MGDPGPLLAESSIGFEEVFVVVMLLSGLVRSIFEARKKRGQADARRPRSGRRRAGQTGPVSTPLESPDEELLEGLEEAVGTPTSVEPPPRPVEEPRREAAPLGLDLGRVESSLPSRHEEDFESHRRQQGVAEGRRTLAPLASSRARPRRPTARAASLRRAIVLAEVLGAPVALRHDSLARSTTTAP